MLIFIIFIGSEIVFTSWGSSQPNDPDGSCLIMRRSLNNYDWDDVSCQERFPYACQLGKLAESKLDLLCKAFLRFKFHELLIFTALSMYDSRYRFER